MIQNFKKDQITLINKEYSSLYIDNDSIVEVTECCVDWDIVNFSGVNKAVVNSVKVIIKRQELEEFATYQYHETPQFNVIQEEQIEKLDFSNDWVWTIEDDSISTVKGVQINFKELEVCVY